MRKAKILLCKIEATSTSDDDAVDEVCINSTIKATAIKHKAKIKSKSNA